MEKVEILEKINNFQLNNFLKFVKYQKFNLYPNVNSDNIHKYLFEIINNSIKDSTIFSYTIDSNIIALVIVRSLNWDSQHFGFKCSLISNVFYNQSYCNELCHQALGKIFCKIENEAILNNTKFISVSINSEDSIVCSALQTNNFKFILTWVDGIYNSKEKIQINKNNYEIGIMKKSELEYYKNIASNYYFKGGRFYLGEFYNLDHCYSNNYMYICV